MISAEFTINGATNPAVHSVSYGSTVNLELISYVGATSIGWEIVSCSDPNEPIPVITRSGTPPGRLASFVMPADSSDGYGRSFLIKCIVSSEILDADGANLTSVKYGVVGALNERSLLPIAAGEENYRHGTHGYGPEINIALKNGSGGSGGSGDVVGPVSSTNNNIVTFNGTTGKSIKDSGESLSGLIHANGSVVYTADQSMGTHKITSLSSGTLSTDAVNKGQLDAATGSLSTVTTDRLLGRDTAGTGAVEQLTVGGGVEFTGSGGVQRSAISGDITVPAGSNTSAITAGVIVNSDINAAAGIAVTKIAGGSAVGQVLVNSSGNVPVWSALDLADPDAITGLLPISNIATGFVKADGTVPMTADLNINTHKVIGVSPGTVGTDAVNKNQLDAVAATAIQPFKATYYVNPDFIGTSTGSAVNPFTTIAAAFAAGIAAGYVGAVIILPPNTTVTENVVFPSTGGNWEITSQLSFSIGAHGTTLVGSITMNATTGDLRAKITNILITGNITGDVATSYKLLYQATSVRQTGSITLTSSGGACAAFLRGVGAADANKFAGSNTDIVSVAGRLVASNWVLEGGISEAHGVTTPYPGSQFRSCQFGAFNGSPIAIGFNGASLNSDFFDCTFVGPTTFTSSVSNYVVYLDGPSRTSLNQSVAGSTFVNCVPSSFSGTLSVSRAVTTTVSSTAFGARSMPGLHEAIAVLDITSGSGSVIVNVIYKDRSGALTTEAVLNGTISAGKLRSSTLPFVHDGTTAIAYSVTVTGTIAAWLDMSINFRS